MDNSNLNFNEFKSANFQDWHQAATKQLKGDDPLRKLKWEADSGLPLGAYYTSDQLSETAYLKEFSSSLNRHNWKLLDAIVVDNAAGANKQALEALNGGCDGVLFEFRNNVRLDQLTAHIEFSHCQVSFNIPGDIRNEIDAFVNEKGIKGFILEQGGVNSFHSDSYSEKSLLKNMSDMVLDFAGSIVKEPIIFIRQGQDFFHELARIRALRYLFHRVALVQNMPIDPNGIWIHAEPKGVIPDDENWFTQSSSGLAAIIGGANSVSFNSMDTNPRISRNVGNLIRYESKIEQFNDVAMGSYFIDYLTDQMVQHVWSNLQKKFES